MRSTRMNVAAWRWVAVLALLAIAAGPAPVERRQDFHADPAWDGHRNRLVPSPAPVTRQDFGYRPSRRAGGKVPGEIGGRVQRSVTPAWYAKVIPTRTLNDRLRASGTFAVTGDDGGSGVLFGWFHDTSRGWRTPNSLTFRIDGNGGKYWVFFEYGTRNWLTGGAGTFEGPRYQTTRTKPFAADGTVHRWSLSYDPDGNNGGGTVAFGLDGKTYPLSLAPGHRADGAAFNRFGMFNQQSSGGGIEVYLDDLVLDGEPIDLGRDPGWEARGNSVAFEDRVRRPWNDFGFQPTSHAGGRPGELGGVIWRDERPAYYADRVGPLTLDDELTASGTLSMLKAGSDSGVYLGWFNAAAKAGKEAPEHRAPQESVLGLLIEGPSRVGHYVRPVYRTAGGAGGVPDAGPILRPDGTVHRWSIHYAPREAGGRGRITVTLDGRSQSLDLKPGHRARGAAFDRFGLFNHQSGGHMVEIYLDDLTYTAGAAGP
jgi:hypothetical protein